MAMVSNGDRHAIGEKPPVNGAEHAGAAAGRATEPHDKSASALFPSGVRLAVLS
jgi:hypothetical protein